MKCTRVDHVGIAVKDLAASLRFYEDILGLKQSRETEVVDEQKVTVAFLSGTVSWSCWRARRLTAPSPALSKKTARGFSTSRCGWMTLMRPWRS